LAPEAGELASLVAERDRLKHAEKLLSAARGAEDAIYGRDASISGELAQIGRPLGDAADIDARLRSPFDRIEAARAELEEAGRDRCRRLGRRRRPSAVRPSRKSSVHSAWVAPRCASTWRRSKRVASGRSMAPASRRRAWIAASCSSRPTWAKTRGHSARSHREA